MYSAAHGKTVEKISYPLPPYPDLGVVAVDVGLNRFLLRSVSSPLLFSSLLPGNDQGLDNDEIEKQRSRGEIDHESKS